MDRNKIFVIVFVCVAVICPVEKSSASKTGYRHGVSTQGEADDGPCDTCPRQGKCVPRVSCPAHMRPGSSNPECHLKGTGKIGVCCYTGHDHAAEFDRKSRARLFMEDAKSMLLNASKARWNSWSRKAHKLLAHSDDTVVSFDSPDYGHRLSSPRSSEQREELGRGALLNLFAAQDLKALQGIDDDELALGITEADNAPYCPPQPICPDPPSWYRSCNGECTNPEHPTTWGAANTGYERLLPPDYSDGLWALRTSVTGNPLPSPRAISVAMLLDGDYPSAKCNMLMMQWCQFIAHDISGAVFFTIGNGSSISCCTKDGGNLPPEQLHWACAPIFVHPDDVFFSRFNRTCLNFVRAQLAPDCSCAYAKPMNGVTHVLDLSQMYGKDEKKQNDLRAPSGKMKTFNDCGRELPPLTDRPECLNSKSTCFDSGDNHGNQLITLTVLHTAFTRLHNLIAAALTKLNPGCDDSTIFYKTKAIAQAIYQNIVYGEWLPLVIGEELMETFNLRPCEGYASGYDPTVNPSLLTEFAGAAMRFGHSTVQGKIQTSHPRTCKTDELISIPQVMFQPDQLRIGYFLDRLIHGMTWQPMQTVDPFVTHGLTRYLFRGSGAHGLDLASLNLQRGRDFGIRSYNHYRVLCGLPPFRSFKQYPLSAGKRLATVYESPEDVDLWIGCLLEKPEEDALVGPTCAFIIAEQFSRLKKGDRYYFEYGSEVNPGALTPSELEEVRKVTIARVMCDARDGVELTSMPPRAFMRPDLPGNHPVECGCDVIPSMDMSKFKIK